MKFVVPQFPTELVAYDPEKEIIPTQNKVYDISIKSALTQYEAAHDSYKVKIEFYVNGEVVLCQKTYTYEFIVNQFGTGLKVTPSVLPEMVANFLGTLDIDTGFAKGIVEEHMSTNMPKIEYLSDEEMKLVLGAKYVKSKSSANISQVSKKLPGMQAMVPCPLTNKEGEILGCTSYKDQTLWSVVQHLNDDHKWSREKIADWIDELHDTGVINAEFAPWGEEPVEDSITSNHDTGGVIDISGDLLGELYIADMGTNIPTGIFKETTEWKNVGYTPKPINLSEQVAEASIPFAQLGPEYDDILVDHYLQMAELAAKLGLVYNSTKKKYTYKEEK